jgi:hypothetical protein
MTDNTLTLGLISPQDWSLDIADLDPEATLPGVERTAGEIETRIRGALREWLPTYVDSETGALVGYYRPTDGFREPPQTANLIGSWLFLAAYDRDGDEAYLERARTALDFYYRAFVVSHPMSVVAGGARDGVAGHQVWTKFSAEFLIGALGLYDRTEDAAWLRRAEQSGRYLMQAARHGFAPMYNLDDHRWTDLTVGWDSWGRAVEACLLLGEATGDAGWRDLAVAWGEHGLEIQAENGCFYLIDAEYFNTDLTADELRGLCFLYEVTGMPRFLDAAQRFADWLLEHQRADGAWVMTLDRDDNVVMPTVGPGDMPNIAVALLRLHHLTGEARYLEAALGAFRYALSTQVLPGSGEPFEDDPSIRWGFWSWDPYYDYTQSPDQATHHVRGLMFLLDYVHWF